MVQENIIFGIDIARGSLHAKEKPAYSVVILKNGDFMHHKMVSLHKFMRLVWKEKPSLIAVDNIYEIVLDKHDLISFLEKLPPDTKLIQVTGGEQLLPLIKLAPSGGIIL